MQVRGQPRAVASAVGSGKLRRCGPDSPGASTRIAPTPPHRLLERATLISVDVGVGPEKAIFYRELGTHF